MFNLTMALNKKKYYQAIIYLCSKLDKEIWGKKKLAKLLYYVDFDAFEKDGEPITGDTYRALPMGPFPMSLREITAEMQSKKMIEVKSVAQSDDYAPTEVYKCLIEPDISVFQKGELEILERIIRKYGHLNGKQLEDLTHAEAPYVGSKPKGEIPYELAYYRGTDFGDA